MFISREKKMFPCSTHTYTHRHTHTHTHCTFIFPLNKLLFSMLRQNCWLWVFIRTPAKNFFAPSERLFIISLSRKRDENFINSRVSESKGNSSYSERANFQKKKKEKKKKSTSTSRILMATILCERNLHLPRERERERERESVVCHRDNYAIFNSKWHRRGIIDSKRSKGRTLSFVK